MHPIEEKNHIRRINLHNLLIKDTDLSTIVHEFLVNGKILNQSQLAQLAYNIKIANDELVITPSDNSNEKIAFSRRTNKQENPRLDIYYSSDEIQTPQGASGKILYGLGTIVKRDELTNAHNDTTHPINNDIAYKPTTRKKHTRIIKKAIKSNDESIAIEYDYNNTLKHLHQKNEIHADIDGYQYIVLRNLGYLTLSDLLYYDRNHEHININIHTRWTLAIRLFEAYNKQVPENIAHLDIKPSNILVKFVNPENDQDDIKIYFIDFGLAQEINTFTDHEVVTVGFKAPELLWLQKTELNQFYTTTNKQLPVTKMIDYYALGEILAQIFGQQDIHRLIDFCYFEYHALFLPRDNQLFRYYIGNALIQHHPHLFINTLFTGLHELHPIEKYNLCGIINSLKALDPYQRTSSQQTLIHLQQTRYSVINTKQKVLYIEALNQANNILNNLKLILDALFFLPFFHENETLCAHLASTDNYLEEISHLKDNLEHQKNIKIIYNHIFQAKLFIAKEIFNLKHIDIASIFEIKYSNLLHRSPSIQFILNSSYKLTNTYLQPAIKSLFVSLRTDKPVPQKTLLYIKTLLHPSLIVKLENQNKIINTLKRKEIINICLLYLFQLTKKNLLNNYKNYTLTMDAADFVKFDRLIEQHEKIYEINNLLSKFNEENEITSQNDITSQINTITNSENELETKLRNIESLLKNSLQLTNIVTQTAQHSIFAQSSNKENLSHSTTPNLGY